MSLKLLSKLDKLIGIDLGTSRVRVWSKGQDIVIDEPPCIATDMNSGQVLAVGSEAAEMEGRVGSDIKVSWFIVDGQISNARLAKAYFKLLFKKNFGEFILIKPVVMISIPTNLPQTKKDLFSEIFYDLGMSEVYTISQSLAAAIGAGVPVADASGCFILQMGAGIVEGAVISMGRVVVTDFSYNAGNFLSEKIAWEVKKETLIELPDHEVEQVKKFVHLGLKEKKKIKVSGQDLKKRVPKEINVENETILPVVEKVVEKYVELLNNILSKIPPELTTDVIDKGLLLSGEYSNLKGLEEYLIKELKISVSLVDDQEKSVIKGISFVLENLHLYKESLGYAS
ncbi:MAG: rod shape-determining protein [Candidatus Pacebacteria bacterium]|nr:rod shape-determining protein [Candidatus Paceibacterota bacterium]